MSDQFYITSADGQKAGPYDLVAIVKKIRNGNLTAETLVATDSEAPPKRAADLPQLAEFIREQSEQQVGEVETHVVKVVPFSVRLATGWRFLQHNQLSTMFSGLHVIFIILSVGLITVMPAALHILAYSIFLILIQFFFTAYIFSVLRMVRGQPVDFSFIKERMKPLIKPLFYSSIIMSFPMIIGFLVILGSEGVMSAIGLFILVLPGFYMMSLFIFAPMLILDKGVEFWEAMDLSRKTVQKSGLENISIIFSLLIINFLCAMGFFIPMIISLPITISAISDMYDESFA